MQQIEIKRLKQLSLLPNEQINEHNQRELIYFYILMNKGIPTPEVFTASIPNQESFNKNLEIAKDYFKTFIEE